MRQKLLLVVAVFFGVVAFALTFLQINEAKRKIAGSAVEKRLVKLTRDVAGSEVLAKKDITMLVVKRLRKERQNPREILWSQYKLLIGRKLETSMRKNSVLQWDDLAQASQRRSGLAGYMPADVRAVTISVDSTSSVNNMIKPGDQVDIVGTFRFPEMRGDRSLDTLTMTILQSVTILACGSDYGKYSYNIKPTRSRGYNTVTLALYPEEVDMIIFASQKGRLTFTLRNYDETKIIHDLPSINFKYLEKNIAKFNRERERRRQLQ
ncbi:MAG: Flp pilus assembly protein CpaB [Victivallaceae bacterium]|nr:Flp pilus assembly protein CpaB [Victivallaceae bacterium]